MTVNLSENADLRSGFEKKIVNLQFGTSLKSSVLSLKSADRPLGKSHAEGGGINNFME